MTLVIILLAIAALIGWTAYKNKWEIKATLSALATFAVAVWTAFTQLGTPTP